MDVVILVYLQKVKLRIFFYLQSIIPCRFERNFVHLGCVLMGGGGGLMGGGLAKWIIINIL